MSFRPSTASARAIDNRDVSKVGANATSDAPTSWLQLAI